MKEVKDHLLTQAQFSRERAERAEAAGRRAAKESAGCFADAESYRKQAAEFQALADAQPV